MGNPELHIHCNTGHKYRQRKSFISDPKGIATKIYSNLLRNVAYLNSTLAFRRAKYFLRRQSIGALLDDLAVLAGTIAGFAKCFLCDCTLQTCGYLATRHRELSFHFSSKRVLETNGVTDTHSVGN